MKSILKSLIYIIFKSNLIRYGDTGAVYVTYDDGPHPENTDKILEVLSRFNVKATFFMVGVQMEKYPEIVKSVIEQGHILGYHSYRHRSLKKMTLNELHEDFRHIYALSEKFKYPIKLYRPPYGDVSLTAFLLLLFKPWKIVMWSLDSRDSFDTSEQVIANIDTAKLGDGEIVLLHEDYQYAVEVIESLLKSLQAQNICCGTL